jgi:hypothetical protein
MKRKRIVILAIAVGALLLAVALSGLFPDSAPESNFTDCDAGAQGLQRGKDWEYVDPADANRITTDCRPVLLLKK